MKVRAVVLIAMLLTGIAVSSKAQEQGLDDKDAIRRVVKTYFEAFQNNDLKAENKAVHAQAVWLFSLKNERLYISPQKRRLKAIKDNARRGVRLSGDTLRIDSIDVTGEASSVKLAVESQLAVVTHYLLLLKDASGEWKIVAGTVWPAQKVKGIEVMRKQSS